MAKKRDDDFSGYSNLLNEESRYMDSLIMGGFGSVRAGDNEDEIETFSTSKEIIKKKEREREVPDNIRINNKGIIEDQIHFQRFTKRREHKYTEKEMETIRESCRRTIVHDYGEHDWFHVSDEERMRLDQLHEISMRLQTIRGTYTLPSQYIRAMRVAYEAWNILARLNYLHEPEEFFELVAQGKIVSSRIIMPKLRRMNNYNLDLLVSYISNPELDETELDPKKKKEYDDFFNSQFEDEIQKKIINLFNVEGIEDLEVIVECSAYDYQVTLNCSCEECIKNEALDNIHIIDMTEYEELDDDWEKNHCANILKAAHLIRYNKLDYDVEGRTETEKEQLHRLLSPDDVIYISNNRDNPKEMRIKYFNKKLIKGYDKRGGTKRKKGEKKKDHRLRESLAYTLNKIQEGGFYKEYSGSHIITESLFELPKREKSFWDDINFDASWTDDEAVEILDMILFEELQKQPIPREKWMTYGDKALDRFFKAIEESGLSALDLRTRMSQTTDDLIKKTNESAIKSNKKKEAALLQRVLKLSKDPHFKKITKKAETALSEYKPGEEYIDDDNE